MTKSTLGFLLFLCTNVGAFQVPSPIRTAPLSPPVLIPQHHHATSPTTFLFQQTHSLTTLHQSFMHDDSDDAPTELPMVEIVEPSSVNISRNKDKNAIAKLAKKLKQALSTHHAAFFLSLSMFLLPFFVLSSFPESALAVQSGGRMGGSFGGGGSNRQSSSRTYIAPSSGGYSMGYNREYSRGYSSGPNVIVSPGISPFYSPFYTPFYARPSGVVVSTGPSFGGFFFIVAFFLLASTVLSNISSNA
eukprot:983996_1